MLNFYIVINAAETIAILFDVSEFASKSIAHLTGLNSFKILIYSQKISNGKYIGSLWNCNMPLPVIIRQVVEPF